MLRITLHTGRKHQIRVHLSESGTPSSATRITAENHTKKAFMLAAVELAFDIHAPTTNVHVAIPEDSPHCPVFTAIGANPISIE